MLIAQTADYPASMRHALVDLLKGTQIVDIRIASAYVTVAGSEVVLECLKAATTLKQFEATPKILVTSFDYGLTEPAALSLWSKIPKTKINVAGIEGLLKGNLYPGKAFHPKIYAFATGPEKYCMLVGSANMTSRGFTVNAEVAWAEHKVPKAAVIQTFTRIQTDTTPLSDDLLSQYKTLRGKSPPSPQIALEIQPVPAPKPIAVGSLELFRDAVESGEVDPKNFSQMWVQCEKPQGGSGNQIELARGAHRFFGLTFSD